ncbi:hypothetical protein IC614_01230 [Allosphingosinicella flava]|uniref:Spore coat protein U domain-containing protein n=1 Tax=Allosphingosinicella flava TaxID=2771430 RepID=A0A7T2LM67_9SPHN|nr:hypothetical protein [Sphingosinicella flava]QPQ55270.1 hypothetical protein IC614_01230 [Sphingosinicella flava]
MASNLHKSAAALIAAISIAAPAQAENVTFSAALVNSCVLSLSVPGTLAATSDGTTMTSETGGGLPATMTLVAVGAAPTVNFAAPSLSGPSASTSGATTQIRYTSLQGANQAYTSGTSSRAAGALLDTFTVHSRVTNNAGFTTGTYTVTTVVTCQQ